MTAVERSISGIFDRRQREQFHFNLGKKPPREGTKNSIFHSLVLQGLDRDQISDVLKIPRRKVSKGLANLRRGGYLEKPTHQETTNAIRNGKGNLIFKIKPFVEMGMSTREIYEALLTLNAQNASLKQVGDCVGHGRYAGFLPKLTDPRQMLENRRAGGIPRNRVVEKVERWIGFARWFLENGYAQETMPKGRATWIKMLEAKTPEQAELFYSAKRLAEGYQFTDFSTFSDRIFPKEKINIEDQLFLETYYYARVRRAYDANQGDFAGLGLQQTQKIKQSYGDSDEDIFTRLNPYIKLIQANTATTVEIKLGLS